MTAISIIMPCFKQAYHLRRVLEAYDQQSTQEEFEVIAIDDASPDETLHILTSYHPNRYQLHVLRHEKNRGPAAARNLGIETAQSPLIIFVGDDILPENTFVQEHLQAHRQYPEIETAILGHVCWPKDMPVNTLMKHIDGMGAQQFSYHYFKDGQEYDYRHFYTANISIKHALFTRTNKWFDTDFPFAAYEDVELSYRLSKVGMRIIYAAQPVGYHYHYHTIWSFSERQFRAGRMAVILGKKHPSLRPTVMGKNWLPHMALLWAISKTRPVSAKDAFEIEQTMLHLTSSHEWSPNLITDGFYLKILHHFYYKGIVEGMFEKTGFRNRVVNLYTIRSLGKIIKWYAAECAKYNLATPSV